MSYDEADALADYARANEITYTLFSDPDSEVISDFGILNTLIAPDDHPWYGIPLPGSYVIAPDGSIQAKFFESSFMLRQSADLLLRSALGEEVELPPAPPAADEVVFDVTFDGEVSRAGVMRDLIVRFHVPVGFHLYGDPVPDGMVATSVEIDPAEGVHHEAAVFPPTSSLTLGGSGETVQIFDGNERGEVLVRVPITHFSRSTTKLDDGTSVQPVTGTVRWQACDSDTCQLPRTESFAIDIPAQAMDRAGREARSDTGMDFATHMHKMVTRRTDRSMADIMTEMTAE